MIVMKKFVHHIFTVLIGVIITTQIIGCTLIGLGVGLASSKKSRTVAGGQFDEVKENSAVSIQMKDGALHEGFFKGIQFEPIDSYVVRYHEWYRQLEGGGYVPYLDEEVSVTFESTLVRNGTFKGFDEGVLYLESEKGTLKALPIEDIAYVTMADQEVCDGARLLALAVDNPLPYRTGLALADERGKNLRYRYLNPTEIEQIQIKGKKNAATGAMVGLVLDIFFGLIASHDLNESSN